MGYYQDMRKLVKNGEWGSLIKCSDKVLADLFMKRLHDSEEGDFERLNTEVFTSAAHSGSKNFCIKLKKALIAHKKDIIENNPEARIVFMNKTGIDFYMDVDFTISGQEAFLGTTGMTSIFRSYMLFYGSIQRYIDICINNNICIRLPRGGASELQKVINDLEKNHYYNKEEKIVAKEYAIKLYKMCRYKSKSAAAVSSAKTDFYCIEIVEE